jgi:hypothetical protein
MKNEGFLKSASVKRCMFFMPGKFKLYPEVDKWK